MHVDCSGINLAHCAPREIDRQRVQGYLTVMCVATETTGWMDGWDTEGGDKEGELGVIVWVSPLSSSVLVSPLSRLKPS